MVYGTNEISSAFTVISEIGNQLVSNISLIKFNLSIYSVLISFLRNEILSGARLAPNVLGLGEGGVRKY